MARLHPRNPIVAIIARGIPVWLWKFWGYALWSDGSSRHCGNHSQCTGVEPGAGHLIPMADEPQYLARIRQRVVGNNIASVGHPGNASPALFRDRNSALLTLHSVFHAIDFTAMALKSIRRIPAIGTGGLA